MSTGKRKREKEKSSLDFFSCIANFNISSAHDETSEVQCLYKNSNRTATLASYELTINTKQLQNAQGMNLYDRGANMNVMSREQNVPYLVPICLTCDGSSSKPRNSKFEGKRC